MAATLFAAPVLLPARWGYCRVLAEDHVRPLEQGAHAATAPGLQAMLRPVCPEAQAATLLPRGSNVIAQGDRDAAATASLPSHELWASQLPPLHGPPGPRLRPR